MAYRQMLTPIASLQRKNALASGQQSIGPQWLRMLIMRMVLVLVVVLALVLVLVMLDVAARMIHRLLTPNELTHRMTRRIRTP